MYEQPPTLWASVYVMARITGLARTASIDLDETEGAEDAVAVDAVAVDTVGEVMSSNDITAP